MTLKERLYRFRSFWIFPLAAAFLLDWTSRSEPENRVNDLLWLVPAGILAWTLIEYLLHRFVFHTHVLVHNRWLREVLNSAHPAHHASPRDPGYVLVLPIYAAAVSLVVYGLCGAILRSWFSAAGFLAGIWTGFLYYETVHYRVHFSLAGSGFVARQRRAHFYHHFTNNKRCFGVTSPIWDYIFGTGRPIS
jgi:dihydroceramide fatty acyl 2-hydroxylase